MKLSQKTKQLLFMKKSILTSIAIVLVAFAANAQSVNHTVTVKIPDVLEIKFNAADGNDKTIEFADAAELEAGAKESGTTELKVRANKSWAVNATAATEFFLLGTEASTMPATALSIIEGSGAAQTLDHTTGVTVKTGTKGGFGLNGLTVKYSANPGLEYEVGDYTLNVVFTVSAD